MGWWSVLQISNTGAWCCRSRTPTFSRNTGALQQHGTDKIGEGAQAVVAALPAQAGPSPRALCSVCCWGQRDRAGGRAGRSAGMTPTSCLCGWLASSKGNSSLHGVLCYPNPHNGDYFFFQVVKSQTFLKQGRGALVTAAWARLAPAYHPAPPARQGWLPKTSEIAPFVKLTCGPNDNFPAWVCRMI